MKNLYKKGKKIHPLSPPSSSHHQYYLSLLPATLFSLTTSLSDDDIQVLAYLISCYNTSNISIDHSRSKHNKTSANNEHKDQQPLFECNCFWCYTRFWAKWDKSPNRKVIDEIIEGYEDGLVRRMGGQTGRNLKKGKKKGSLVAEEKEKEKEKGKGEFEVVEESGGDASEVVEAAVVDGGDEGEGCVEKGGVRKIVSLIGEKIWGMWNRM